MSMHLLIRSFLKTTQSQYNIDEKSQDLKLLLVTAIVNPMLYLDPWARMLFVFIFIVISNILSVTARSI